MTRTDYHAEYYRRTRSRRLERKAALKWARWLVMSACTELAFPEAWRVVDSGRVQPVRRPVLKLRRV